MSWCVLEHLTRSPKYVAPAVIDFFGAKNATAALISPSKRQKRHRGPDRPKIRPSEARSEGFASCQFKLSQFRWLPQGHHRRYRRFFWFIFLAAVNSASSNLDLGQKFGQFRNFQQLCLGRRANINVYPSLERVLYLFVYDRLTWLSRLKPAL